MARRGEARQRLKAPENRATSRAAPPGAEAPEGTRRRPAVVAARRPRLAGLIGGADEPRAPRRERPQAAVVKFGGVQPRPRGHSGKAWCRAALAETFRSARTCPCAGPQGLPERERGAAGEPDPSRAALVGRPAREANAFAASQDSSWRAGPISARRQGRQRRTRSALARSPSPTREKSESWGRLCAQYVPAGGAIRITNFWRCV